ncbi:SDR family oxidoreductase [bacterium]|nr:SDR family oxidoreductase [bacterium]
MGEALARAGATVWLASREQSRLDQAIAESASRGVSLRGVVMDPNVRASVEAAFDTVQQACGTEVTILVNGAGGNQPGATVVPGASFADLQQDALRQVIDTNVMAGAIVPSQVLFSRIARSPAPASIIMVGSVSSLRALTRVAGYGMAKAAVENLTRWLAVHAAHDLHLPVRVNAIVPGFFLTEQNRFLLQDETGQPTARGRTILERTPMGRLGQPDELGGTVVWLASDASRFVTGASIVVDGGFMAWSGV